MITNGDLVTISKTNLEKVATNAFKAAGRTTIERMIELAEPEHQEIVREVGRRCLAEIGEDL